MPQGHLGRVQENFHPTPRKGDPRPPPPNIHPSPQHGPDPQRPGLPTSPGAAGNATKTSPGNPCPTRSTAADPPIPRGGTLWPSHPSQDRSRQLYRGHFPEALRTVPRKTTTPPPNP